LPETKIPDDLLIHDNMRELPASTDHENTTRMAIDLYLEEQFFNHTIWGKIAKIRKELEKVAHAKKISEEAKLIPSEESKSSVNIARLFDELKQLKAKVTWLLWLSGVVIIFLSLRKC
jgi:hypothetical protein